MEASSIRIVSQSHVSRLYGLVGFINVFIDILPVAATIYVTVSAMILLASLLGPWLFDLLTAAGFPQVIFGREFYVDTQKLGAITTLKSLVVMPILFVAFLRDGLSMPVRSRGALVISLLFSLPFLILAWRVIEELAEGRYGFGVSVIVAVSSIFATVFPEVDANASPAIMAVVLMAMTLLFSSLSFLLCALG
ncbi:MAG: hypothetical protein AB7I79_20370 [Rhizobiaceae bacterium]